MKAIRIHERGRTRAIASRSSEKCQKRTSMNGRIGIKEQ